MWAKSSVITTIQFNYIWAKYFINCSTFPLRIDAIIHTAHYGTARIYEIESKVKDLHMKIIGRVLRNSFLIWSLIVSCVIWHCFAALWRSVDRCNVNTTPKKWQNLDINITMLTCNDALKINRTCMCTHTKCAVWSLPGTGSFAPAVVVQILAHIQTYPVSCASHWNAGLHEANLPCHQQPVVLINLGKEGRNHLPSCVPISSVSTYQENVPRHTPDQRGPSFPHCPWVIHFSSSLPPRLRSIPARSESPSAATST